jgi:hypothetical protein
LIQHARRLFVLFVFLTAFSYAALAQNQRTITVRMVDTRSGVLIATTNYLVRINHQETEHGDWITKNEDGSGKFILPADADVLSIHATYEAATLTYVNCDADKDHGSADHAAAPAHWYPVADILTKGVVAPNQCVGKKIKEKLQVVAKPGEFVFFVRPLNSREQFSQ